MDSNSKKYQDVMVWFLEENKMVEFYWFFSSEEDEKAICQDFYKIWENI